MALLFCQAYVKMTHGATHSGFGLEVQDVFELDRQGESERFRPHNHTPNRMLLWHGSRLSNFTGILSQGLRIAPPEAPVSGYMFGKVSQCLAAPSPLSISPLLSSHSPLQPVYAPPSAATDRSVLRGCDGVMKGVYFADVVSKSAGYCATSPQAPTACMLLCDVALGEMNEKLNADYNANHLPKGKLSTKGIGRVTPDATGWKKLDDGCVVPCGAPINQSAHPHPSLMYNGHNKPSNSRAAANSNNSSMWANRSSSAQLRFPRFSLSVCVCVYALMFLCVCWYRVHRVRRQSDPHALLGAAAVQVQMTTGQEQQLLQSPITQQRWKEKRGRLSGREQVEYTKGSYTIVSPAIHID